MWNGPKIFGIGLSKTGTTSLTRALSILGCRSIHYPSSLNKIKYFDAATDTPIALSYKMLDAKYPGSKFIYTVRDQDEWLRSCKQHWMRHTRPNALAIKVRLGLYNRLDFCTDSFSAAYAQHEKAILDYFRDRPNDLLILNICSGGGWSKLCQFLKCPVPAVEFPRANITRAGRTANMPQL